jgi:hypothetical protein
MTDQPMPTVPGDLLDLAWRAELARRSPGVSAEVIEEYCDFELHPSMRSEREELRPILAAVLAEHAQRVLTAAADQLDAMPETDGAALKGPYWYRDGWKQATSILRDWAEYPAALADRIARGEVR